MLWRISRRMDRSLSRFLISSLLSLFVFLFATPISNFNFRLQLYIVSGTNVNCFSSLDVYNLLISFLLSSSRLGRSSSYAMMMFFGWYAGIVAPIKNASSPRMNIFAPASDPCPVLILLTSVPNNDSPARKVSRIS